MGYLTRAMAIRGREEVREDRNKVQDLRPNDLNDLGDFGRLKSSQVAAVGFLEQRWGPSPAHTDPSIVIPHDWRSVVANWEPVRWSEWRALATTVLAELSPGERPDAARIRAADYASFLELTTPAEYACELERLADLIEPVWSECWARADALVVKGMDVRQAEHVAIGLTLEHQRGIT
jgi:hypothetical protein